MVISAFLVEDRPEIRSTLIEAMEEMTPLKFVGEAETESGARDWLSANDGKWDIAIVDLFLADGSGFGVLKDCQHRKPGQKVVVLTSYSQQNILDRCRDLGADEVFDKSQDVEKLVQYCKVQAAIMNAQGANVVIPLPTILPMQ